MLIRTLATAACCTLLAATGQARTPHMPVQPILQAAQQPLLSPPATADVTLNGKTVTIHYNSPRLKGRSIGTTIVPYGKVWRTGANPATTMISTVNLKIGTLDVPAGTYTIYTLPNADQWMLIINKQNGQWGTEYHQNRDLGRTPMQNNTLPTPQENMSITFEKTRGGNTELHIKWGTVDRYVSVQSM